MSDVTVTLTHEEAATLILDRFHADDCPARFAQAFFLDGAGAQWRDCDFTEPFVKAECSCGYFDRLQAAQDKVKVAMVMAP